MKRGTTLILTGLLLASLLTTALVAAGKNWVTTELGALSQYYETGNSADPGYISTVKGDSGGTSYGIYMFVEKTVSNFMDWLRAQPDGTTYRDMGDSPELKDYYEKDARLLITKWSDTPAVTDYANRSLSTLTREYYLVRWARFIDEVTTAEVNGVDFDEQKFTEWCYEFETAFPNVENRLHYTPRGDAFTVAKRLCAKYEGEVLQSSPIIASGNTADGGCHDMVLLYSGGNHRELKWNAADCAPNVSYTDENGKEHWLFDSYLFLEIYSGLTDNDV